MADVTLTIGGHSYTVSCRDGEEDRLRKLGAMVHERTEQAKAAVGNNLGEARTLLFAALLLADEADENAETTISEDAMAELEQLAERLTGLGDRLAQDEARS
jgi:cell division protein ZapA